MSRPSASQAGLQPESGSSEQEPGSGPNACDPARTQTPPLDPTRYGDWEKNGRCIDF